MAIYLKQLRSGNFEFSNKEESSVKFENENIFKNFVDEQLKHNNRIIKARYSRSQTYFFSGQDALFYIKKSKMFGYGN